jgi:hypothetical protein
MSTGDLPNARTSHISLARLCGTARNLSNRSQSNIRNTATSVLYP